LGSLSCEPVSSVCLDISTSYSGQISDFKPVLLSLGWSSYDLFDCLINDTPNASKNASCKPRWFTVSERKLKWKRKD